LTDKQTNVTRTTLKLSNLEQRMTTFLMAQLTCFGTAIMFFERRGCQAHGVRFLDFLKDSLMCELSRISREAKVAFTALRAWRSRLDRDFPSEFLGVAAVGALPSQRFGFLERFQAIQGVFGPLLNRLQDYL